MNLTSLASFESIENFSQLAYVPVQFWSMMWTFLLCLVIILWVRHCLKKADPKTKPTSTQIVIISAYESLYNFYESITLGRLRKAYPFFMALLLLLGVGAIVSLFGFENQTTSIMFTFGLSIISFIGIFVVAVIYKGWKHLLKEKFINPLELFSSFSPLLSLAIRLFGGSFAFGVMFQIVPQILFSYDANLVISFWPLINVFFVWFFKTFDLFLSLIQAFVFMILTIAYWNMELPNLDDKHAPKKLKKKTFEIDVKKIDLHQISLEK